MEGGVWMIMPDWIDVQSDKTKIDSDGKTILNVAGVCWFTNVDHVRRHTDIETPYLYSKKDSLYPELYPKYDNYDAINIDKVTEIPMDYEGIMGVPITFMDKYNPEQFEIVGKINNGPPEPFDLAKPIIDGSFVYKRIAIRRKAEKTLQTLLQEEAEK